MNKQRTGRKYEKLTDNALKVLARNRAGRGFWRRFHVANPCLVRKRQGTVSVNRALNCTRTMAEIHLDDLASDLIDAGIFGNAEQVAPE